MQPETSTRAAETSSGRKYLTILSVPLAVSTQAACLGHLEAFSGDGGQSYTYMRGVLVLLGAVGAAMPAAGFLSPLNVMRQGVSSGKLWLHELERCLTLWSGGGPVEQSPSARCRTSCMAGRQGLMASLYVNCVRSGTRAPAFYEQGVAL